MRVRAISTRSRKNRPENDKATRLSLSRNLARILLHPDVAGDGVFEREFDFVGGTETVVCPYLFRNVDFAFHESVLAQKTAVRPLFS